MIIEFRDIQVTRMRAPDQAGIEFTVVEDERTARDIGEKRAFENKALAQEERNKVTLENLFATLDAASSRSSQARLSVAPMPASSRACCTERLTTV